MLSYAVPIVSVSHGADFAGKILLSHLAAQGVDIHDSAVVELGATGWIATVLYTAPGRPSRQQVAHVGLVWPERLPHQNQEAANGL